MTGQQTLLARAAVGVAGSATTLILLAIPSLRTMSNPLFKRMAVAGLMISRLGLFCFAFLVLHLQPRGDVGYYWNEALAAMGGGLPYRDFGSSYAPLDPYLDLLAVHLWHSQLALILLAILAECAMFPMWLGVGRRLFPEQQLRVAAFFYLASPMSLIFVSIDGQNNVIIAFLLAAAMALLLRRSETLAGVAVALTLSAIKILGLLFTPLFFFAVPRRWRWLAGAVAVAGTVYGTALALHMPIMQPLTKEGAIRTAGNLPYVIEAILGFALPSRLWDSLSLAGLIAVIFLVARTVLGQSQATRLRVLTFAMPAMILTLVLLSKKGWPNYMMLVLFPLCLLAPQMGRANRVLFALFGVLAVVEHSYWASLLNQVGAVQLHDLLLHGHQPPLAVGVMLGLGALEVLLIAAYCWLLTHAIWAIMAAPAALGRTGDALLEEPRTGALPARA